MAIVSDDDILEFVGVSESYFEITASNDVLVLTSDKGSASIDVADGTYDGDDLATALQTAMNANTTLTGTGAITFVVSYSSTTRKFTIDATAGHTIAYTHSGSDGGLTFGFDQNHSAAQTITSDNAAGDPTAIILTLRDEAEAWIENYCRRTFESTTYTLERYDGNGLRYLTLKNRPVTALYRLSIGTRDVIKVRNTAAYTHASVSVTSTGVVVEKDGTASAELTFATYTTMALMVAAISA